MGQKFYFFDQKIFAWKLFLSCFVSELISFHLIKKSFAQKFKK